MALLLGSATGPSASGQSREPPVGWAPTSRLDAVVTDRQGRPLANLSPDDLELRDDGSLQTIEAVELRSPTARPIAVYLDEFHVHPANTVRIRDALAAFVQQAVRAEDLVLVLKSLDSLTDVPPARGQPVLRDRVSTFEGRMGDYRPRTAFEQTYMNRAPDAADAQRAQVALSALHALVNRLGELREGRKTLVLVSEGFVRRVRRETQRVPDVQAIVHAANRAGVAIYVVDPGSSPEGSLAGPPKIALRTLADETGGELVAGDDLTPGLRRVARNLDAYYEIAYQRSHADDGRAHAIELRVKRPDASVSVRTSHPGERSSSPPAATPSTSSPFSSLRRPQQISPLIRPWFGTSRGSDGRTRVTFTWEPNRRTRLEASAVTLSVASPDGTMLYQGRVEAVRSSEPGPWDGMRAVFEAQPGVVQIDMTIWGTNGQAIGSDSRDIQVRDMRMSPAMLSTPEVFRSRTARELRALSGDASAAPVVSREFSRTETLLIRVRAYGGGEGRPRVRARLVGAASQTLRELMPVSPLRPSGLIDARGDGAGDPHVVQFDLPLAALANGQYGIELVADDTGRRARELILIRITG